MKMEEEREKLNGDKIGEEKDKSTRSSLTIKKECMLLWQIRTREMGRE